MTSRKGRPPAGGATTRRRERRAAERAARKRSGSTGPASSSRGRALSIPLITGGAIVVGVVGLLLLVVATGGPGADDLEPVAMPEGGPPAEALQVGRSLGDPGAPVQIELYEDPQCPACSLFTQSVEPLLVAGPISEGQAFLTYRDLVFIGDESLEAAAAMRVAEALDGKFWEFRDVLYHNQGEDENGGAFSTDRLATMAELVGLERDAFLAELDDPDYEAAVEAETAQAREAGIGSTPTLVINGEVSAGVPDWDDLRARIETAAAAVEETAATPEAD